MHIAPSILSADFANLARDIKLVEEAGVTYLHIDIMDGHFVPNITFGANVVSAIRPLTNLVLDCHLMVTHPERQIAAFVKAGADVITVHYEASTHLHGILQQIKQYGVKAGVVINPATPVSAIEPILGDVDQVLVMTVNPGFGGQTFIRSTLAKIRQLATWRRENDAHFLIEVDGGVNEETAQWCIDAGADILVAGSYIYQHQDPLLAIDTLKRLPDGK